MKYSIIYADPPWEFKVWGSREKGRSPENHYRTMPHEEMKNLDIQAISAEDCVLLMWATSPHLSQALELGRAWGFEYKTIAFVWVKKNRQNNMLFMGMGHYTRSNAELVLLFTRGHPLKRLVKDISQVVITKLGVHSMKPPEVRTMIVRLFGDLPRVELFARSREGFFPDHEYKGWDVFGDEVNQSIVIKQKMP